MPHLGLSADSTEFRGESHHRQASPPPRRSSNRRAPNKMGVDAARNKRFALRQKAARPRSCVRDSSGGPGRDHCKRREISLRPQAIAPKRVVKRYSNRKLYDTKDSRYVTLLQIAEMVRAGEEVQIIDNNTKEDLTEVTLAQIIYEEQKQHSRTVPLQTLKDLIHQRGEKVLSDLREGPIGRLLPPREGRRARPRRDAGDRGRRALDLRRRPRAQTTSKKGILEQSREAIEDSADQDRRAHPLGADELLAVPAAPEPRSTA